MIGQRFGRLTVIAPAPRHASGASMWTCRCECGAEKTTHQSSLKRGLTRSCGCLAKEQAAERMRAKSTKHGYAYSGTYRSWQSMLTRCTNQKSDRYRKYGAKGITVCDRWRSSFEAFLADMGERPEGTSIDRIDGSRGYEPGNCRWATMEQQLSNRRGYRPMRKNG